MSLPSWGSRVRVSDPAVARNRSTVWARLLGRSRARYCSRDSRDRRSDRPTRPRRVQTNRERRERRTPNHAAPMSSSPGVMRDRAVSAHIRAASLRTPWRFKSSHPHSLSSAHGKSALQSVEPEPTTSLDRAFQGVRCLGRCLLRAASSSREVGLSRPQDTIIFGAPSASRQAFSRLESSCYPRGTLPSRGGHSKTRTRASSASRAASSCSPMRSRRMGGGGCSGQPTGRIRAHLRLPEARRR